MGFLLTTLAVVIILVATLIGIGRTLIPHADALRPWVEQLMSQRIGQAVTLDQVEAQWPRLTPSLSLIGIQLDDGQGNRLEIDQARLEVHLPRLLDRQTNLVRLVLLGLELVLEPDEQGRWGAELAAGAAGGGDLREQLPLGDLVIRDATVRIRPQGWPELPLHLNEGGIQRRGAQTQFHGVLNRMSGGDERLDLRLLIDHPEGQWSSARGWLGIEALALESLWSPDFEFTAHRDGEDHALLALQLWLDWSHVDERLRLDLDFELSSSHESPALAGSALLEQKSRRLQLEVSELLHGNERVGAGLALARRGDDWAVAVDDLDLARLHAVLDPWLSELPHWPLAIGGRIGDLLLGLNKSLSLHAAAGRVEQLMVRLANPMPSVDGLELELGLDGDRLSLVPGGQPTASWAHHLRTEVVLDELSGRVLLSPDTIELRGLSIHSAVADATANGWIYLQRPRPFLDFLIEVHRLGPTDPRPYLSYRTIPATAMDWLDQSFTWVEQASGWVNLHLVAGTEARNLQPGSYQAMVEFSGAEMDFWPGWPPAVGLDGRVEFLGRRLGGALDRADLGRISVSAPILEIADLTNPEMIMQLEAIAVDAGDLTATLGAIQVAGWQAVLEPMHWSGPVDVRTRVALPFRTMENWDIEGVVDLQAASVELPAVGAGIDALSGSIGFDRSAVAPAIVAARLGEQSFELALAADFDHPASLDLSARLNPVDLFRFEGAAAEMAAAVQGASHWTYRLEGAEEGLRMTVQSDLRGLALDWPAPLDKPADLAWASAARLSLDESSQRLELQLGQRLAGELTNGLEAWSLALALGGDALPPAPVRGARVAGRVGRVALGDWLALLGAAPAGDQSRLPETFEVQLRADELELPGLLASPAELTLERIDDAWVVRVDSPELAGSLNVPVPADAGRAVVADLARLHLRRVDPETVEQELLGPALEQSGRGFSPIGLPPLSLLVEDLRWGDLTLGRLRLEAHPVEEGLEVELIDASGSDLRLQGRGRWVDTDQGPMARFLGRLSTPSLSALLRSGGYDAGIEASRAQIDMDIQWPGGPADFALRRLLGTLDLRMTDGQIPEARPGAGRLLGLVSFNAIPRRLMLDFRDVFGPGMRFDEIDGRFTLAGGFASTDGVVLRSTAAVITISGETDMAARQYDQEITVEPGLGASLPVIGVLAGGPVGAAAGLVLRQLLERPLRGLAEVRYQVTGPWDAPEIELVAARLPDEPPAPKSDPDAGSLRRDN